MGLPLLMFCEGGWPGSSRCRLVLRRRCGLVPLRRRSSRGMFTYRIRGILVVSGWRSCCRSFVSFLMVGMMIRWML